MAGAPGSNYNQRHTHIQAKFEELIHGDQRPNSRRSPSEFYRSGGQQYGGQMKFQGNRNFGKEEQQFNQNVFKDPSEENGNIAIQLIMENKIMNAIQQLTQALEMNPTCAKHYVNRGFCYLRLMEFKMAEKDIQLAFRAIDNARSGIKASDALTIRMKAHCILAQAYCGMKNYAEAEKALKYCLIENPRNQYYLRELIRIRTLQLTEIGFSEADVIRVIAKTTSAEEAVALLADNVPDKKDSHEATSDFTIADEDVFDPYDNEKTNPSNTFLTSEAVALILQKGGKNA